MTNKLTAGFKIKKYLNGRKHDLTEKTIRRIIFCVLLFSFMAFGCSVNKTAEKTPADYVNPFVDTHKSRWFYFSSACRPFGMVNLSPDTDTEGSWNSGCLYDSPYIRCFSHIHGWQLSGIAVMPTVGEMNGHLGMEAYKSRFTHEGEIAQPGYHKVYLKDYGIWAELTSTTRVGFHRYSFPGSKGANILFDVGAYLAHGPTAWSEVVKVNDRELEGKAVMAGTIRRPKDFPVYFVARFSRAFDEFGGWEEKRLKELPVEHISGEDAGAYVSWAKIGPGEEILVKVAISYTSVENARKNLEEELPHWDFDRVRRESFDEWNSLLGRIKVKGGTEKQKVKFYTDLWHALLGRRIVSDADGKYMDMTGNEPVIRQVKLDEKGKPIFPHYNFDALWGTHWSLNILWSIAYPEIMDGFGNTMTDMYKNGGLIPRGPAGGNYTFVMIGDPAAPFFASAYNKGIRGYDVEKAYAGLRKNAFPGGLRDHAGYEHIYPATGGGMEYYVKQGWVPEGIEITGFHADGASMTLEYAYQDWCLAQMAKSMGKEDDYKLFMERSENYKNIWDAETGWMRPRELDGSWMENFKPVGDRDKYGPNLFSHVRGFCESNSAIYSYFVPHDMAGLISLFGGAETFAERLNEQFEKAKTYDFVDQPHHSAWVAYTNQPGTGMAHLFNYAGKPWLTQKWVREVKEAYGDTTAYGGYHGDEDQGQMGALGVLMAIGLFEVDGGANAEPYYEITSPVFDEVEITLNPNYYPGKTFKIITKNNSDENRYIQSARLNGRDWNKCWFAHEILANGGTLELIMGDSPNKSWGSSPEDAPHSPSSSETFKKP